MRFSLIGDSYASQSPNQSAQRTRNWYKETAEDANAKSPAALYPSPGLKKFASFEDAIYAAPVVAAGGGGSLPLGYYYARFAAFDANGIRIGLSAQSSVFFIDTLGAQTLNVPLPVVAGVDEYRVYVAGPFSQALTSAPRETGYRDFAAFFGGGNASITALSQLTAGVRGGGIRASLVINGRTFVCGYDRLIEVKQDGTTLDRGALPTSMSPCSMASSGTQLLIVANGDLKLFNLGTNLLTGLSDPTGVAQVGFSDGYFIALLADSNKFRLSGLLDAAAWDPADISEVSVFPDNVVSMIIDHRELALLGSKSSIPYYNSGDLDNPFQPIPNGFVEQGCGARFATVRLDNSVFWLGADERGQAVIWRAVGYTPQRVSNHVIEYAMQQYARVDDAIAFAFQMNGHAFYRISFPTADATWEYDASTGSWHEVGAWDGDSLTWHRHRGSCHVFAFGKHLVGDYLSDTVYQMSDALLDDAGTPIRRERISGVMAQEDTRIFFSRLRVAMETGVAPIPALLTPEGDPRGPLLMVSWSKDGGHTWSNEVELDCGQGGEFFKHVELRRLGYARNLMVKIAATDAVVWRILDGYVEAELGSS